MKKSTKKIIENLFERIPQIKNCKENIEEAIELIRECYYQNRKILICGNGGSAADSLHIVGELMKGFILKRRLRDEYLEKIEEMFPEQQEYFINNLQEGIPAISLLGETALISAYSNDNDSKLVFAQQVLGYGNKGDILIAISTSGNSENIVYASQIAKVKDIKVLSLTGRDGGKLKQLSDININVEEQETYLIQEYHLPIYHTLCLGIENEIFGEDE